MQVVRSESRVPSLQPRTKTYDVCIVGSGAGGGIAAKELTEAGADVVLLEAGAMRDSAVRLLLRRSLDAAGWSGIASSA